MGLNAVDVVVGVPYSGALGVTGQTSGLTVSWAITGGSLPPGLSLNPATGAVTGTPTQQGYYVFYAVATNVATGATKQDGGNITVHPAGTVL